MLKKDVFEIVEQNRDKLMLADSADAVIDIIKAEGGKIGKEDAANLFEKLKEAKKTSGVDIDDDEMEAVAGGTLGRKYRDWIT